MKTHCCFCGQQCGIQLKVRENRVIGFEPWEEFPFNRGMLCPKGVKRYMQGNHPDRLLSPLMRSEKGFRPATWDEALDFTAGRIREIQEKHGKDAIAIYGGASLSTEKSYLMGKLARVALGTRHIDYNGRLCMVSAGTPYGVNQAHPNAYKDILRCIVQNRDNLGYAWRILRDGCCDGCSLGTSGLHDWTMKGVHLCNVRLELLRLNTMPDVDYHLLEDVRTLQDKSEKELRQLGRLSVPMIRRRGDTGFQRISWDEMTGFLAEELHRIDPKRLAWYMTSRGLTNEAYYAHQKVARFIGTNHVDTSARICHAPSTAGLSATVGCAATTCSYYDWVGADLVVLVGTNLANNQPVATKYLHYAKKAGTKVFMVNPYFEPGLERYWVRSGE